MIVYPGRAKRPFTFCMFFPQLHHTVSFSLIDESKRCVSAFCRKKTQIKSSSKLAGAVRKIKLQGSNRVLQKGGSKIKEAELLQKGSGSHPLEIFPYLGVGGTDLHPDPRLALWHHRKAEPYKYSTHKNPVTMVLVTLILNCLDCMYNIPMTQMPSCSMRSAKSEAN